MSESDDFVDKLDNAITGFKKILKEKDKKRKQEYLFRLKIKVQV